MKKPNVCMVFGKRVPIKYKDLSETGLMGYFDTQKWVIVIDISLKDEDLYNTLLHEQFHAVWRRIIHQAKISYDTEEIIVEAFSKFLVENYQIGVK